MRVAAGMTLLEILVVIGIVLILGSLLFPVLSKATERGRMATCLSNQRQLAMAIGMAAQDNQEVYPSIESVWTDIDLGPKVLRCKSDSADSANSYVYNADVAGKRVAAVSAATFLTADGRHVSDDGLPENIATSPDDFLYRHHKQVIISYVDGHAAVTDSP